MYQALGRMILSLETCAKPLSVSFTVSQSVVNMDLISTFCWQVRIGFTRSLSTDRPWQPIVKKETF